MSKVQTLRAFVKQRLSLAAEEIFELFERTIAEYEEQLCRQNKLLDADAQLLSVSQDQDPPEQQGWSSGLDQEDPPELPHIKEEQEEVWIGPEGEQGPEEDEIKVTVTPVAVKSEEDDEEEAQSSQLHQTEEMKTEDDGEDCGGPGPAGDCDPDSQSEPGACDRTSDCSEDESDDSWVWEDTREPRSGSDSLHSNGVAVRKKHMSSAECAARSDPGAAQQRYRRKKTGAKQVSCAVCSRRFTRKESLTRHMAVHTGEKKHSCSSCGKRFSRHYQLKQHQCGDQSSQTKRKIHGKHLKADPSELDCGGSEPDGNLNPNHSQTASRDKTSDSSEPETDNSDDWKRSSGPQSGLKLRKNHSSEKLFGCSACPKRFSLNSSLKRHMMIHSDEKPFSCSICSKRFTQKVTVRRHMALHTGEKRYSCSACGKRFTFFYQLKNHQCVGRQSSQLQQNQTEESRAAADLKTEADGEDCGGPEPTGNSNPECAASFGHKGDQQKHSGVQAGPKLFSCSVCHKKFSWKYSLTTHMRIHSEEKLFSCLVCKKTFQCRGHLVMHMRVHTGEKPFSCTVCGKGFSHSSHLTLHLRVHTGEKPFTCSVCEAGFSDSSTLTRHMRVHTGEKPFSCSVCGKTFGQKGTLSRHLAVHTGEKQFACSVCGKRFSRLMYMKKHICVVENSGGQVQQD